MQNRKNMHIKHWRENHDKFTFTSNFQPYLDYHNTKMELWNSWGTTLNTKKKKKPKTMVKLNQLVTRINLMEFVIMLEILADISNVTFTSWPFSYFTWHFQQVIASFLCQKHENSPQSKELPMCITTNKLKHNSNHNQSINMFSFKEKLFKD